MIALVFSLDWSGPFLRDRLFPTRASLHRRRLKRFYYQPRLWIGYGLTACHNNTLCAALVTGMHTRHSARERKATTNIERASNRDLVCESLAAGWPPSIRAAAYELAHEGDRGYSSLIKPRFQRYNGRSHYYEEERVGVQQSKQNTCCQKNKHKMQRRKVAQCLMKISIL
jgi:hypothetical protein